MTEQEGWDLQKASAAKAFDYWIDFMGFAGSDGNPLSADCKAHLFCMVRLVSWVESQHGTVGANEPKRDPMQCGNPNDTWWQEITGKKGKKVDRFIRGPGKKNYWAPELPGAVEPMPDPGFDIAAIPHGNEQIDRVNKQLKEHSQVPLPDEGHNDPGFTPWMSYFWGIIYLLHKFFGGSWKLEDCSCKSLLSKAAGYNGGGDLDYAEKLNKAAEDIGCCKDD